MTRQVGFFLMLIFMGCAINAQQITQQFTFTINDVQTDQSGDFDIVKLTGESYLQGEENAGKPQLPVKHFKLLLPQGASASNVSITINTEQQMQGSYYLLPVQMPIYPNYDVPPAFVEPDLSVYNSNTPFPANYILNFETNGLRDYNYVTINFSPFRYIPLNRQLYLLTNVIITVDYTLTTINETHKLRPYGNTDKTTYDFILNTVVNPTQTDTYYPEAVSRLQLYQTSGGTNSNRGFEPTELPAIEGSPVHYVIITNNTDVYGNTIGNFTEKFQQLAEWKIQRGSPAKVIAVDAIRQAYAGVDIAEKIREFIKDAHKFWGTEYVLLGGNANIVPVRHIPSMPTDLYYSAIWHPTLGYDDNWNANGDINFGDGADFTPDIAVGRAPVDTDTEADLFVEKNFTYYRCSFAESIPDGGWLNKHLNLQGITFEVNWNNYYPKNGLKHSFDIIQAHHTDSEIYGSFEYYNDWENVHPDYCPAYYPTDPNGCTTNQVEINDEYLEHDAVVNQLNQRYGIINHFEHSGPLGLGLCFVTNSTQGLRADDFQNLASSNKYGIFISGGCETVPIANDYYISEQWINAPNGGVAFLGSTVDFEAGASYSYNYNFFNSLYTSNIHNIGLTNSFTASNSYLYKIVNLLGDPELSIYTDEPVNMNVTHVTSISVGTSDINVNVIGFPSGEEVKISLYKENEVYAFTETLTGSETLNITPDTPGELKLTVTCHNAEPYEAVINVLQSSGAHLYISDITIIDENSNGFIEPGETINLSVELTNSGATGANNISGVLSTSDANTVISQDVSAYPDIPSVQTGNSLVNYTFTASTDDIYNGKVIPFELDITSAQGQFLESFFLNIKSAQLEPGNRNVLVNGIETNIFNPGDVADVFIDIHNFGTVMASNLTTVLSTGLGSNIVSVTNSTQLYDDIDSFEKATNTNPFGFVIEPDYAGEDLLFDLTVTDGFGRIYLFELNFTEAYPDLIEGFDFSSGKEDITLYWSPENNIKGYNVLRCNTEEGNYEKLNDFIVSGSSMFYDPDVEELSEYYYKISVVTTTGNELNLDELTAYKAWTSLDIHAIYPIKPAGSVANASHASVSVADIDGNSTKELFPAFCKLSDGMLMGFYETGQELYNIDGNETSVSGFAATVLPELNGNTEGGELRTGAAIGDIDNDGNSEVFVTTYGSWYAQQRGYLFGFKTIDIEEPVNHPDPLWNGIPINLGHRSISSPVLSDLDGDGFLEIIVNQERQEISIYNNSGILQHQRQIGNKWYSFGYLAVADLNFDGTKEIVIGTLDPGELYILNADLTDFNGINPIYSSTTHRLDTNPVIADIDNDGEYEILITGRNGSTGNLYAFNIDGSFVSGKWDGQISINFVTGPYTDGLTPQPAVGDLNDDGLLEVVIADENNVYVFDNMGNNFSGFPLFVSGIDFGRSSPVLADIDSDDEIEIIISASNNRIYAFNPDGSECVGWRLSSNSTNGFAGTPTISDLDNDGYSEIIVSDADATTHVWKTTGDSDKIEWGSYRANPQNTGEYRKECVYSVSYSKEVTEPNIVWNTDKHIQGNLIIQPGADLTITSKVSFVGESKVIVKPGAKLIINGGRLTNSCSEPWAGIEVWGNSSAHQYKDANGDYQQGYVELKNGAVIENAWEAIQPWNPEHWNQTGGIINANGAIFKNNRRAVQFISYENFDPSTGEHRPNQSKFRNCTFETTPEFDGLFERPFHAFVSMFKVDGVRFYGCDFLDSRTDYYNQFSQSIGIWTIDANFYVLPICDDFLYDCWTCPMPNIVKSSFTGLNIGVYSTQSNTSSSYVIDRTDFIDNLWGNLNVANDNASIIRSDFEIGTKQTVSPYYPPFGIINYGATGLTIHQNSFEPHINLPANLDFHTGIWNYNTGGDFNAIFKNDFTEMGYANMATGLNNNETWKEIGLNFQCNTNSLNIKYDFYVNNGEGIASYQGTEEIAAGNTFCP